MGEMDADLPTLDWLAGVLTAHADAIGELGVTARMTMPDSPIQALSGRIAEGAARSFEILGGNYRRMAEATRTSRNSYEELDTAFAAQLHRYTDPIPPR